MVILAGVAVSAAAQSGDNFSIAKSAISNGGDSSSGGDYTVKASLGQAFATEASSGGSFNTRSGFWPDGGIVVVSGQLWTSQGRGIRRGPIRFTDPQGNYFVAHPGVNGQYRFNSLIPNTAYMVTIQNTRFQFPPQSFTFSDNAANLTIMALP